MKNVALSLMLFAAANIANAQVDWTFGNTSGLSTPSSGIPVNLGVSVITQNNNNGTTALLTSGSASSGYTGASGNYNAGCAAKIGGLSVTSSSYFEFTLTPSAGYVVAVSGFNFGIRSTGTGPQSFCIRTSIDGFASNIASGTIPNTSTWTLEQPSTTVITTNTGTAITIRIYGYDGTGAPITNIANWRMDDLKVDAAIGLPSQIINPPSLNAMAISSSQINIVTAANAAGNNILVAYNFSNTFGMPINSNVYSSGNIITGGGTVLYNGPAGTFNHTFLNAASTYYYRVWSVNSSNDYSSGITTEAMTLNAIAGFTELVVPKYIGASAGMLNTARTPFAVCLQFDNLLMNTSYDIKAGLALPSEPAASYGSGNLWNSAVPGFQSVAITVLNSAFTTNASGSSGPVWLYFEPTGGANFTAGTQLNVRISYVKTGGTISTKPTFFGTKTMTCLDDQATALTPATADDGAFIKGITSSQFSGKYVLLYDNEEGNGDPLFSYQVINATPTQTAQSLLPTAIDDIYRQSGTAASGYFPAVIPTGANNLNGVRRIEFRNADYSIFSFFTEGGGIWNGQSYNANTNSIARNQVQIISLMNSYLNNFYTNYDLSLLPSGNMIVNNNLSLNNASKLSFAPNSNLTVNGIISGNGFLAGNNSSQLTIGGTNGGNAGTIRFSAGNQLINNFQMNRTGGNSKIILGSNVTINNNLSLLNGTVATDNNLFTWANSGGILSTNAYSQSYVCTCDVNGNETTIKNGNAGFRVNNVSSSADVYFPVGTDYNSANRMMINNSGTADYFTVVVGKGDVGNTPLPRVNRIWYVNEGNAGGSLVTMKLFFTKRDPLLFPSPSNDEVETGFNYGDIHLVQETYANQFINNSNGSDVQHAVGAGYGNEIYGLYTKNISADINGNTNGINSFSRFSVVNAQGIVLPVQFISFYAQKDFDKIKLLWTAMNETNIFKYEVERSADAISFQKTDSIKAKNIAYAQYQSFDLHSNSIKNYYRIKAIDKNGKAAYSKIILVNGDENKNDFNISPNPVTQHSFRIYFAKQPSNTFTISISATDGKIILNKRFETITTNSFEIYLPKNVSAGNYAVKIITGEFVQAKKIVVE